MNGKQPNSERIRELRLGRGWSQQQLGEIAGVSPRTVQRVEAGRGASQESLRAIAAAFDTAISELLKTPAPPPPLPKVALLPRIRTGEELCAVVSGAHMYQQQYDTPSDDGEVDLIGSFLQETHDIGEIWDDVEPMQHVRWSHSMGKSLQEIEEAGFRVYASRITRSFRIPQAALRQFPGADTRPFPMDVATVLVLRGDNPRILNPDSDREMVAVVAERAAA